MSVRLAGSRWCFFQITLFPYQQRVVAWLVHRNLGRGHMASVFAIEKNIGSSRLTRHGNRGSKCRQLDYQK